MSNKYAIYLEQVLELCLVNFFPVWESFFVFNDQRQ